MITLVTHCYNEQFLMPWFVAHHLPIVDHAVVIDYASTDHTVEIVHDLAPKWDVIQSRNNVFRATDVDAEVMDVESMFDGWKIALNTTEFLCGDIHALTQTLDTQGWAAAQIKPVAMVDLVERVTIDHETPLVDQCYTGHMDSYMTPYKSRLIHNHTHGDYHIGRHSSKHQDVRMHPDGALIKWFGFAPWCPETRARRMQIQSRIPQDDIDAGRGYQHMVDSSKLTQQWQYEVGLSGDLRNDPNYF